MEEFRRVLEEFGRFWEVWETMEEFRRVLASSGDFGRVRESFGSVLGEF